MVGQQQHYLCEDPVYLLLHSVAETVDGIEVGKLVAAQPHEVLEKIRILLEQIDDEPAQENAASEEKALFTPSVLTQMISQVKGISGTCFSGLGQGYEEFVEE